MTIRVCFPDGHCYDAASASEFLQIYADLNHSTLQPPLVNPQGAKSLIGVRALFYLGEFIPTGLDDDAFLSRMEVLGMVKVDRFDQEVGIKSQ